MLPVRTMFPNKFGEWSGSLCSQPLLIPMRSLGPDCVRGRAVPLVGLTKYQMSLPLSLAVLLLWFQFIPRENDKWHVMTSGQLTNWWSSEWSISECLGFISRLINVSRQDDLCKCHIRVANPEKHIPLYVIIYVILLLKGYSLCPNILILSRGHPCRYHDPTPI